MEAPPPPPPHGATPQGGGRSGGLPDGKYDIFVIPPHSSGSGFVYLPSLQTQRNSFLAGVFCTASAFFLYHVAVPVVKEWLFSTVNSGGTGVFTLVCGVAVVAWAFGKTQSEWQQPDSSGRPGTGPGGGGQGAGYGSNGSYSQPGAQSHTQPPPHGANVPPQPPPNHSPPPQSSWQKPGPQANTKANTTNGKTSWEKAREETRKREEERKRAEELKKRREELEKERQRQKDELEKDRQKAREKELRERLEREIKEKRDREEKERQEKEAAIKVAAERIAAEKVAAERERMRLEKEKQGSPKRPPMPTATTEREDDAYSFRPYDRPKRTHKANSAASMYSESSYAPSVSTAKTSPPPSMRGPYSTNDPDKIVIKGVFSFNNAFMRTPISQLRSGQGNVTDGLILRITTEGLFIDDDVRGVPQREWDVKAWTMKLAEVWCPNVSPPGNDANVSSPKRKFSLGFGLNADSRRETPSPSQNESSAFVAKWLKACGEECKDVARTRARSSSSSGSSQSSLDATASTSSSTTSDADSTVKQSCELAGMHVLRASIRDQEGKKYVFVLSQSEGWKVAVGLQKLRRGSQVRALGVAGMPMNEAKALLDNLGYA